MSLRRTQAVTLKKTGETIHVLPREIDNLLKQGLISKDTKARKPAKVTPRNDAKAEAARKIIEKREAANKAKAEKDAEIEKKAKKAAADKARAEKAKADEAGKEKDQKDPGKTKEEKKAGETKAPSGTARTANITSPGK